MPGPKYQGKTTRKKVKRKPAASGFANAREAAMYGGSKAKRRRQAEQVESSLRSGRRESAVDRYRRLGPDRISAREEAIALRTLAREATTPAEWRKLQEESATGFALPELEKGIEARRATQDTAADDGGSFLKDAVSVLEAVDKAAKKVNPFPAAIQEAAKKVPSLTNIEPPGALNPEYTGLARNKNKNLLEDIEDASLALGATGLAALGGQVAKKGAQRAAPKVRRAVGEAAEEGVKGSGSGVRGATSRATQGVKGKAKQVAEPVTKSRPAQSAKAAGQKVSNATPAPAKAVGRGAGKTVRAVGRNIGRRKLAYLAGPGALGAYGAVKSGDPADLVTDPAEVAAAVAKGTVSEPGKTAESSMAALIGITGAVGEILGAPILSGARAIGTATGQDPYTAEGIAQPVTNMTKKQLEGLREYFDTFTSGDLDKMEEAVVNEYGVTPIASVAPMGLKPLGTAGKKAKSAARTGAAKIRTKRGNQPYDPERPIFLIAERRGGRIETAMNFGQAILGKRIERSKVKKGIEKAAARARRGLPEDEYSTTPIPTKKEQESGVQRKPEKIVVGADAALYEVVNFGLERNAIAIRRWIADQLPAQERLAARRTEPLREGAIPREWSLRYLNKHLDKIVANDDFWNATKRITDQIAKPVEEGGRGYSEVANARAVGETRTDGEGRFDPIPQPEERAGLRTRVATGEKLRVDAEAKIVAKEKQLKAVQRKIQDANRRGRSSELKALEKKAAQIQRRRDELVGEVRQIEKNVARQDPSGLPLTPAELEGITDWTTATEHGAIQRMLYNDGKLSEANPEIRKRTSSQIRRLDAAFRKQRPLPRDIVVYHRFPLDNLLEDRLIREGNGGRNPGYLATSLRDNPKFREAGQLVEIRVPKGSKVINVPAALRRNPMNESEVLLPRNTYFEWVDETPDGTLIYQARTPAGKAANASDVSLNRRRAEELSTLEADLFATRQEARAVRDQERAATRDEVAALRGEAKTLGTQVREGRAGLREPVTQAVKDEYVAEVQAYADAAGIRTDRWLGQRSATVKSDMMPLGGVDNLVESSRMGRQKGEKPRTGALSRQGNVDNSYQAAMSASVDIPIERNATFRAIAASLFPYRFRPVEGMDRYTGQESVALIREGRVDPTRFTPLPYQTEKRVIDYMERRGEDIEAIDVQTVVGEVQGATNASAQLKKNLRKQPPEEAFALYEQEIDAAIRTRLEDIDTPQDQIAEILSENRQGREYSFYPVGRVKEVQKQLAPLGDGVAGWVMKGATFFNKAASLLLLGTSPVWLSIQFLAETLQGASAISATGVPTPVSVYKLWLGKASREWQKLSPEEQVRLMAAAGEAPGIDQPLTGLRSGFAEGFIETADNSLNIFKAYGLLEGARRLATLKTLGDIDRWKTAVIRRGVAANYLDKRLNGFGAKIKATFDLQDEIYTELRGKPLHEQVRYFANNPKATVQLANYMRDLMGDWYYLTSLERAPAAIMMFYPYLRMSLRYTFWGLPKNHPVKWAILTTLGAANSEQLRDLLGNEPGFIADYAQSALMGGEPTEDNPYGVTTTLDLSRAVPGANAFVEAVMGDNPEKAPLAMINPAIQAVNTLMTGTMAFGEDVAGGITDKGRAALISLLSLPMPIRASDQLNIRDNPIKDLKVPGPEIADDVFGSLLRFGGEAYESVGEIVNRGEGPNTEAFKNATERNPLSLLAPYKPKSLRAARSDVTYQELFDRVGDMYDLQDTAYNRIKPLEDEMRAAKAAGRTAELERLREEAIALRKDAYATYKRGRLAKAELDRLAKALGPKWYRLATERKDQDIDPLIQDLFFASSGNTPLPAEQFDKRLSRLIKQKELGRPAYRRRVRRLRNSWKPMEDWPQGFEPIPNDPWAPLEEPLWNVLKDRGQWSPKNN